MYELLQGRSTMHRTYVQLLLILSTYIDSSIPLLVASSSASSDECIHECLHDIRACSRARVSELKTTLQSVQEVSAREPQEVPRAETTFISKCRLEAEKYRNIPRLHWKHDDIFQQLWPIAIPLTVEPTQTPLLDMYSPSSFNILHGTKEAVVTKYRYHPRKSTVQQKSKVMTVRQFLQCSEATKLASSTVMKVEVSSLVNDRNTSKG